MDAEQPLPPWRPVLTAARKREGRLPGGRGCSLQLFPWMVTRGAHARVPRLECCGDARSAHRTPEVRSVLEIERTPEVELCWLFLRPCSSLAFVGTATLISPTGDSVDLDQHWKRLPASGRSVWAWPPPVIRLILKAHGRRRCQMIQLRQSICACFGFRCTSLSSSISSHTRICDGCDLFQANGKNKD